MSRSSQTVEISTSWAPLTLLNGWEWLLRDHGVDLTIKRGKEIRRLSSFQSVPDVCVNGYSWMNGPSHSAPLSSLTWNKHSRKVASQHETGGLRNTYIREDLKLCTHSSPQDRTAYSTMSVLDSPCALCWMDLCDGTVAFPQHAVGYIVQYAMVKLFDARRFHSTIKPGGRSPGLFPYVVHPIWFMKWYEFIHYSSRLRNYYHFPVRLATDSVNIMKSRFAQGIAAAVKSGHNWLVSTGVEQAGDKH